MPQEQLKLKEKKVVGRFHVINLLEVDKDGGNHRRVITPVDDVSKESDEVKALAAKNWTSELVTSYKDYLKT